MEIGIYLLFAVLGLGFLLLVGYDMNKKSKLKLAEVQLERDKIALEAKKLDFKN